MPIAQVVYLSLMEGDKLAVRLPLMVSAKQADAIDSWRYSNRVPTRAEAIRQLIDLGLEASAKTK